MSEMRTERDSMGTVEVPADAYYGAQTQRAVENFPISGWSLPGTMISAMGLVKLSFFISKFFIQQLRFKLFYPINVHKQRIVVERFVWVNDFFKSG